MVVLMPRMALDTRAESPPGVVAAALARAARKLTRPTVVQDTVVAPSASCTTAATTTLYAEGKLNPPGAER